MSASSPLQGVVPTTESTIDPERLAAAGARFVGFFNELGRNFVEREELLAQVALGLLSREHVLMTGPPGTAKSGVASAVLRRVIDERTGLPSLFARQFTESTVQTDLVGPINFKTLMETGRTEHFTDEGMLGAVHAFLDEVFDGRDMLLRSTLNVLQERELKQGSKTTRGAIECALMTTNRYLAEVLESSRETLLAFVDRIAFVSFVPKTFAAPANLATVLRRQVGGTGMPRLTEALTIQDLDVLQAAAEAVFVPDQVCDALSTLLGMLEEEFAAADRADPDFLPTRYLSTRTAVRSGRILRAVCVYDKLFFSPGRPLEVEPGDLKALRLSILLGGPLPESLAALLTRETDPRERRQLSIIRTEREIFDRCIDKLPPIKVVRRPVGAATAAAPAARKGGPASSRRGARTAAEAPQKLTTDQLIDAARAAIAAGGTPEQVRAALGPMLEELTSRSLREGMSASSGLHDSVGTSVAKLIELADTIEKAPGDTRAFARWTRGRALALLDEAVSLVENTGALASQLLKEPDGLGSVLSVAAERIAHLEKLVAHRNRIRAQGAEEDNPTRSDETWRRAAERAEIEACAILDAGFRKDVATALTSKGGDDLGTVLGLLTGPLAELEEIAKRLVAVGAPGAVKTRVAGPRVLPLIAAVFERISAPDRLKLVEQVEAVLQVLEAHGLGNAVPPKDLLAATAQVLVRAARQASLPEGAFDREHYRKLRKVGHRVGGAYTLVEIAMRVAPGALHGKASPQDAVVAVHEIARSVPAPLAAEVAEIDMERLERSVTFLEQWFSAVVDPLADAQAKLEGLVASGFFGVAFDEQALLRTALEAKLVSDVFPQLASRVTKLRERIEALRDRTHAELEGLVQKRADEAWAAVLHSSAHKGAPA